MRMFGLIFLVSVLIYPAVSKEKLETHKPNKKLNPASLRPTPSRGSFSLKGEGKTTNKKKHGNWKYFYPNGKKHSEGNYTNGLMEGLWTSWYENGQKRDEKNYSLGKRVGREYPYRPLRKNITHNRAIRNGVRYEYPNDPIKIIKRSVYPAWITQSQDVVNGEYKSWHENGQLKSTGRYIMGGREGLWFKWYEDGKKESESFYQGSNERWTYWDSSGKKRTEQNYRDSEPQGLWTYWYSDGTKWSEGFYQKGKKHGLWILWKEDGEKYREQNFADGELIRERYSTDAYEKYFVEGKLARRIHYFKNGKKSSEGNYTNGKMEGLWTSWYESGKKSSEGNYTNGKRDGLWTSWYESGKKSSEGNYTNGKREGLWTSWEPWSPIGIKDSEGNYSNGKRDGVWKEFSHIGPNSSISTYVETIWENGNLFEGFLRSWHENGALKEEGNYTQGKKNGDWETWGPDGNKLAQEKWSRGYLVSSFVALKDDNRSGVLTEWHHLGQKCAEGNFTNGKKSGRWTTWTIEGEELKGGSYFNGLKVGFWQEAKPLFPSSKYSEVNYLDQNITAGNAQKDWPWEGIRDGRYIEWGFNDKIARESNYSMGVPVGYDIHFKRNGTKHFECFYNELGILQRETSWDELGRKYVDKITTGVGEKLQVYYYPNGQKSAEVQYKNRQPNGLRIKWYKNGQKKEEGNLLGFNKVGIWKYWDKNGTLIKEIDSWGPLMDFP